MPAVRRLVPAAAALLALALAGCAGSSTAPSNEDSAKDFRGDQAAVAKTVEDLQDKAGDDDREAICRSILAPELARAIAARAKDTCAEGLKDPLADTDRATFELQVKKVAISGDRATAQVRSEPGSGDDRTDTFTFVRQGRGWRIAQLGGAS